MWVCSTLNSSRAIRNSNIRNHLAWIVRDDDTLKVRLALVTGDICLINASKNPPSPFTWRSKSDPSLPFVSRFSPSLGSLHPFLPQEGGCWLLVPLFRVVSPSRCPVHRWFACECWELMHYRWALNIGSFGSAS